MLKRDEELIKMRPLIPAIETGKEASAEERFQNETLRPVLKMQHDLLVGIFRSYIEKRKGIYNQLGDRKKRQYIEDSIRKDLRFKSMLVGVVIGHFTSQEWETYIAKESELSRRLTDMLIQRIADGML